jgi:hypothetical protein
MFYALTECHSGQSLLTLRTLRGRKGGGGSIRRDTRSSPGAVLYSAIVSRFETVSLELRAFMRGIAGCAEEK